MKEFFTSDIHFSHANIIKYCNRPFQDVDEMNERIIENYNKTVGINDTCYMLGDICMGVLSKTIPLVSRLNGNKILIKGNHDKGSVKKPDFRSCFSEIYDYKEIHIDNIKVVLSHYPLAVWNGSGEGSFMLCGHSHGSYKPSLPTTTDQGKILDVGIDVHNYAPVSWDMVKEIMSTKNILKVDHHGNI